MKLELEDKIHVLEADSTPETVLEQIADSECQEEAFYVMDVGDVIEKFNNWKINMPKIQPFYAVKCNDSPVILELLAGLGCGFDCASKAEIAQVLKLGVSADRIIFANPVKMSSHLKYAARFGVDLMTFDSVCELHKIKAHHTNPKLVLRVRVDSKDSQVCLGMKFGCEPSEAGTLLKTSATLGLPVVGVCFHVGSGCQEVGAYSRAIRVASRITQLAKSYGHNITLLDIGGGFPGDTGTNIKQIAEVVNSTIAEEWPDWDNHLEVIAEPGRYFVSSAYTLAAAVHSVRPVTAKLGTSDTDNNNGTDNDNESSAKVMYYINDGVYGSFNCILFDHAIKMPIPLKNADIDSPLERCVVWGPTCDSVDMISDCALLPRMSVGDWLIFRDMGAYTIPVSTSFNGFPLPKVHHLISRQHWRQLKDGGAAGCTIKERFTFDAPKPVPGPAPASCGQLTPPSTGSAVDITSLIVSCTEMLQFSDSATAPIASMCVEVFHPVN